MKWLVLLLLISACSKKIDVSSSELQIKMKADSEKQRIEQRDKKFFFIGLIAAYGLIMKKIADSY